jgi:hypothetical protein
MIHQDNVVVLRFPAEIAELRVTSYVPRYCLDLLVILFHAYLVDQDKSYSWGLLFLLEAEVFEYQLLIDMVL